MVSRRVFLKNGAFAMVGLGFAPSFLARTALAAGERRARQLIAIFQRGAVDGLSVVVPYGDAQYYAARPSISVPRPGAGEGAAIDLDGFFGFNPRLGPLKTFWDQRALAVVHACGSPDSTRSHFDAQDFMKSATPGVKSTPDGWLNRYLQTRKDERQTPFRAVAVTPQLPRMLQGAAPALAMNQIARFGLPAGAPGDSFEAQYQGAADHVLNGTGHEAFEAMKALRAADPLRYQPAHNADYPRSALGQALRQIAQLTKADVGLEVAFADVG